MFPLKTFSWRSLVEFASRKQKSHESIHEYANNLTKLGTEAFGAQPKETHLVQVFIEGLRGEQIRSGVLMQQPESMEDAIKYAKRASLAFPSSYNIHAMQADNTKKADIPIEQCIPNTQILNRKTTSVNYESVNNGNATNGTPNYNNNNYRNNNGYRGNSYRRGNNFTNNSTNNGRNNNFQNSITSNNNNTTRWTNKTTNPTMSRGK